MAKNDLVTKESAEEAETRSSQAPKQTDGIIRESDGEWAPNAGNEAAEVAEHVGLTGGTLSQEDIEKMPREDRGQFFPR